MGTEIERKFLVTGDAWRTANPGVLYRQGYLCTGSATVRVRTAGDRGFLTVKGPARGIARSEFEYPIPLADAEAMLKELAEKPLVEKYRHTVFHAGLMWVVDEFLGANQGLILAEVELEREDQPLEKPSWAGREVSDDPRYRNASLVRRPYNTF